MDKDYILFKVKQRITELKNKYKEYCREEDEGKSKNNYAVRRAICKRDIQILMLIKVLAEGCETIMIEDMDAVDGFMKLTEPKHRGGNRE